MPTTGVETLDLQDHPILSSRQMSEEEFDQWRDENLRGEWVDGKVEFMAPANTEHSEAHGFLLALLRVFVGHFELGKVWGPELAVKLPNLRRRRVPDVVFVAQSRLEIVRPTFIDGAPDLIMEIVSPDSVGRDWRTKYQEYEAAGVREYWIVDPAQEVVEAYQLGTSGYQQIPAQGGRISSQVVNGFFLKTSWLFQQPSPKVLDLFRELKILE